MLILVEKPENNIPAKWLGFPYANPQIHMLYIVKKHQNLNAKVF